jgi:tetratricopeptide (TPR) repeat protein
MNIVEFLWNPFRSTFSHNDTATREFVKDCKELKFSFLFTNKSCYTGLVAFRNFNTLFRAFVLKSRADPRVFTDEMIMKTIALLERSEIPEESLSSIDVLHMVLYAIHGLFVKENWTGPSYLSPNANNKMKEHLSIDHSSKYLVDLGEPAFLESLVDLLELDLTETRNFTFDKFKSEKFLRVSNFDQVRTIVLSDFMMIDGEDYCHQTKLLEGFILTTRFAEYLSGPSSALNCVEYELLKARCFNLHTKMLENPSETLKRKLMASYSKVLETFEDKMKSIDEAPKKDLVRYCFLQIEYSLIILSYYEYTLSKSLILKAMSLLGIEVNFTGKLGIKTKYQTFKVPQLVVEVTSKKSGINDCQTEEELDLHSQTDNEVKMENKPIMKKLDEIFDNILHEKPVLDDSSSLKGVSLEENVIIIALIENLMKSNAYDDMIREHVTAYLNKAIENFNNWSLLIVALIKRSEIEFSISRKMERSMLQYDQIIADWHSKKYELHDRVKFMYTVNFPSFIDIISGAAENYKKIGCFMAAAALFKDIGLFDEAMVCMTLGGHLDQALVLLDSLPKSFADSPRILCVLGDIHKDITYFERAIEKSDGKYVKAFRALARFYFQKKEYESSLKYYKEAVALNDFNLECWMGLGYIYMVRNDIENAIESYKKAVWIDDNQTKAWANLAMFYKQQGKIKNAFDAMEKAVKINDRNWQMWYNMVIISFENKNFSWFVKSCLKLIDLNHPEQLQEFIVAKFLVILEHMFEENNETTGGIRQIELLTEKLTN